MGDTTKAIINLIAEEQKEVRCGNCGKLLFKIDGIFKKGVDNSSRSAIIVSRCTRSSCKADNYISLSDIF